MSRHDEGGFREVVRGLRVLARLHASGDFVRIQDKPAEISPLIEGWGSALRGHFMICMFLPPVMAFVFSALHVREKIMLVLIGMISTFLFVTCLPRMLARFRILDKHPGDYPKTSMEDRIWGGSITLVVSTGIGIGLSALMINAFI